MTENTAKRAGIRKIPGKSHRALEDYQLVTYGHDGDHPTHFRDEFWECFFQYALDVDVRLKSSSG